MEKRKLEDLNLLDDFLFGSVLTYPGIGEKFARELLRTIFGREFGHLTVVPQKIYYGSDTDFHGARLDVYLEEELPDEVNIVYDVEPNQSDDTESVLALPKRVRFYHAKIDARCLKAGEKYTSLKSVVVIMIMPSDPFGLNRMIYTIRSMCQEVPDLPYDDGARTLFLYTRGTEGDPPEELRQFLNYMEKSLEENAKNETLRSIHEMVKLVKQDEEVSLKYMKIFEREEMLVNRGRNLERENTERERKRAEAAEQRADTAEQEASLEKRRADTAEQRADTAEQAASEEKRRADKAEKELERLCQEIMELKKLKQT